MLRKSSRENNCLIRTPSSKHNFIRSSLKDVENLLANNCNDFIETLAHPSKRLSIFHRVHLANKFARAFSVTQPPSPEKLTKSEHELPIPSKSPPESQQTKSNRQISIPEAKNRVIVYTTSLRVVRSTFEACRTVRSILRTFRVSIDERDLSMDSRFLNELQNLMAECDGEDSPENSEKTKVTLPRVFIGGRYIGGAEEVRQLHESGELKKCIEGLPAVSSAVCGGCGDVRFILCDECRGSHKCYMEKGGFRSCTLCNENGLVRCSACLGR